MHELHRVEAELDAVAAAIDAFDLDAEVRAHVAADRATWTLAMRVAALAGTDAWIDLEIAGGHRLAGRVHHVSGEHVALAWRHAPAAGAPSVAAHEAPLVDDPNVHAVAVVSSVIAAAGLPNAVGAPSQGPGTGLRTWLRSLQGQGIDVAALLRDGRSWVGRLLGVHRDHIELQTTTGPVVLSTDAIAGWVVIG